VTISLIDMILFTISVRLNEGLKVLLLALSARGEAAVTTTAALLALLLLVLLLSFF